MVLNDVVILSGVATFILIIWNMIISIRITEELKKRNILAKIAHKRGQIFKYLIVYKDITTKETGKPGPLYNQFIVSFSLFLLSLFTGIIMSAT